MPLNLILPCVPSQNGLLFDSPQRHNAHVSPAGTNEELTLSGKVIRQKISLTNDFQQAGERYRALSKVDQDHLVDNIVGSLGKADKPIQIRMIDNLKKADVELGKRIATPLKLD